MTHNPGNIQNIQCWQNCGEMGIHTYFEANVIWQSVLQGNLAIYHILKYACPLIQQYSFYDAKGTDV